jgi:hypothetical protein
MRIPRPMFLDADVVKRFRAPWGESAWIGGILAAAVIGLSHLGIHATRPDPGTEADDHSGRGTVVRNELLRLWLPETLSDLARRRSRCRILNNHEELKRFLQGREQEELWYALTWRSYQVNGGFADITIIRHPYREPQCFPEFLAVMATSAGNPPSGPDLDFSTAAVSIIPEGSRGRDAREVVVELLNNPPTPWPEDAHHNIGARCLNVRDRARAGSVPYR